MRGNARSPKSRALIGAAAIGLVLAVTGVASAGSSAGLSGGSVTYQPGASAGFYPPGAPYGMYNSWHIRPSNVGQVGPTECGPCQYRGSAAGLYKSRHPR
jgi:hypothetical protein